MPSTRASLLFALLLALSLGLKVRGNSSLLVEDRPTAYRQLAANLARDGFAGRIELSPRERLTATRARCRLTFKMLDAHGTTAALAARQLTGEGQLLYARDGRWSKVRPVAAPLIEYLVVREVARQGIATRRDPVWIMALGAACGVPPAGSRVDVPVGISAA